MNRFRTVHVASCISDYAVPVPSRAISRGGAFTPRILSHQRYRFSLRVCFVILAMVVATASAQFSATGFHTTPLSVRRSLYDVSSVRYTRGLSLGEDPTSTGEMYAPQSDSWLLSVISVVFSDDPARALQQFLATPGDTSKSRQQQQFAEHLSLRCLQSKDSIPSFSAEFASLHTALAAATSVNPNASKGEANAMPSLEDYHGVYVHRTLATANHGAGAAMVARLMYVLCRFLHTFWSVVTDCIAVSSHLAVAN